MQYLIIFCSILFTSSLYAADLTSHSAVNDPKASATNKAPSFSLPLLSDSSQQVTLASYHGKVIYLDFWASWCTPCRKSLPALNMLRQELSEQGFEVLAINLDESPEEGLEFLQEIPVDYPTLFDNAETAATYQLRGMPTAYLIDREGNLRAQHVGFNSQDVPEIRAAILDLLKQ